MNKPNNVIDLRTRRPVKTKAQKGKASGARAPVVDMTERRQEILTQERRKVKRTMLSEFIGAFIVIPGKGLCKVSMYDISENGVAFDIESEVGTLKREDEVAMRVYMNQQTYFPFIVKVQNVRPVLEDGIIRYGAGFVRGTVNDEALFHFVKFIECISASLKTDHGDVMVSNLRGT